jgi:predicted cupin superfamily sugar epimerase
MLTAEKIRELLQLRPHPIEGGYFVETYRSELKLAQSMLGPSYSDKRLAATAIFYLLTSDTFSAMHKLPGDELFHFYLGDPVEMLQLKPDGSAEAVVLGQDIADGMRLQHCVPGGWWQGSRLIAGGAFALLGTTMSPGFDYADYAIGEREALATAYPKQAARIAALTRTPR